MVTNYVEEFCDSLVEEESEHRIVMKDCDGWRGEGQGRRGKEGAVMRIPTPTRNS
jgi:hypothetical protein